EIKEKKPTIMNIKQIRNATLVVQYAGNRGFPRGTCTRIHLLRWRSKRRIVRQCYHTGCENSSAHTFPSLLGRPLLLSWGRVPHGPALAILRSANDTAR